MALRQLLDRVEVNFHMVTGRAETVQWMDRFSWAYDGASLYDYVKPPGTTEVGRLCEIVRLIQRDPLFYREQQEVSDHDGKSCMQSHGARCLVSEERMLESASWKALRW